MAQPENSAGNCRILSVVWFNVLPPRFGGQKAVALFNKHLSAHVTLVCLCSKNNEETGVPYKVENTLPVSKTQFLNPFVWRKIYLAAKRLEATHLLLEFPYYGVAGVLCKRLLRTKLVVNTHNVEYRRFREQGKRWWPLLYLLEKWTLQHADAVFFKTENDLRFAREKFGLAANRLSVVPYGVEPRNRESQHEAKKEIRSRYDIKEEEKILLFAGTLDYRPNADAVVNLVDQVIPLLEQKGFPIRLIVCGRNRLREFHYLNNLKHERLIRAGEAEGVVPYFLAADVFVNPVLQGGGVQTKTLDALSFHLNVIGFATRNAGIGHAGDKLLLVPDGDWQSFADAIRKAASITADTSPLFFESYNWCTIAVEAYQKIAAC